MYALWRRTISSSLAVAKETIFLTEKKGFGWYGGGERGREQFHRRERCSRLGEYCRRYSAYSLVQLIHPSDFCRVLSFARPSFLGRWKKMMKSQFLFLKLRSLFSSLFLWPCPILESSSNEKKLKKKPHTYGPTITSMCIIAFFLRQTTTILFWQQMPLNAVVIVFRSCVFFFFF